MDDSADTKFHIRILIVDDHKFVREGIKAVIKQESDMLVVAEAASGAEAIDLARVCTPDVILMDIKMPEMDGMEATMHLLREIPSARILILSQHDDQQYKQHAKQVGAAGFLNKKTTVQNLQGAIRIVARGGNLF